jgi:hypothetical protein
MVNALFPNGTARILGKTAPHSLQSRAKGRTAPQILRCRVLIKATEKSAKGNKGGVMFFLLRVAFWLSIVLVLLPSGTASKAPQSTSSVSAIETLSAAGAAVSDMSNFCERQPDACEVGAQAAVAFGQRAQAGAKMVLEFINDRMSEKDAPAAPAVSAKHSQQTLKASDMQPAWRAPRTTQSRDTGRNAS